MATENETMTQAELNAYIDEAVKAATSENGETLTAELMDLREQIKAYEDLMKRVEERPAAAGEPEKPAFKQFNEFARSVLKAYQTGGVEVHSALRDLSVGDDTAGGYLVPDEFRSELIGPYVENAVIRPNATVFNMASNVSYIPAVDVDTYKPGNETYGVSGGSIAYWIEELGSKTESQPAFKRLKFEAHKMCVYTESSDELLADVPGGFVSLLSRIVGQTIASFEDYYFINGTGVGQPLGILSSAARIQITRATANQVAIGDVHDMLEALWPYYNKTQTRWIINQSCMDYILGLTDGTTYIIDPSGTGPMGQFSLYGIPVIWTTHNSTLGTEGDVILADLSQYYIGDRGTTEAAVSTDFRFQNDITAFRWVRRLDAMPSMDTYITHSSGTYSPFVVLSDAAQ